MLKTHFLIKKQKFLRPNEYSEYNLTDKNDKTSNN